MNFSNLISFIIKTNKFSKKWWLGDVFPSYSGETFRGFRDVAVTYVSTISIYTSWCSVTSVTIYLNRIYKNEFRIIIKSLTEEGLLFQGMLAESLEVSNKFPPNFFSQLVKAADEGKFLPSAVGPKFTVYFASLTVGHSLGGIQWFLPKIFDLDFFKKCTNVFARVDCIWTK